MHFRLPNWQWACTYCRRYPLEGDKVWFVSESTKHCKGPWTVFVGRERCPREECPWYYAAPLVYPFHLHCLGTIHQFFLDQKILEVSDWRLRCAEALSVDPIVQDQQPLTPMLLVEAFHELYEKIQGLLAPNSPLRGLLEKLYALPPELQELVFCFSLDCPGGDFLIDKSILATLHTLNAWPEPRQRIFSCNRSLFARWITSGSRTYLAGLYDEHIPGSSLVKADDENWDRAVVTWSGSRIAKVAFIRSDSALVTAGGPDPVQIVHRPTHENFFITTKGLFISRIDAYDKYHPRIFWTSCTHLQCNDIPEYPTLDRTRPDLDVTLTYLSLENLSGISVAHCNGKIEFIHMHRKNYSSSYVHQAHNFVTWTYCPIDSGEVLVVRHSSDGTGLIVAWLCPYIDRRSPRTVCILASSGTKAIYYSSCMQIFGSTPEITPVTYQHIAPHWLEHYGAPDFPSLLQGLCRYQWSFSSASLDNVQAVRTSQKGGIELRYKGFRQCLGDFRPHEELEWYESPDYFKVSRVAERYYTIFFFRKGDHNLKSGLYPLAGKRITFWS